MTLTKGKLLADYYGRGRFKFFVGQEMSRRNPNGDWESPDYDEGFEQTCGCKYFRDADAVFDEVDINADTNVFEMGKSGLLLHNDGTDTIFLPACRVGFCRDDQGICVAVLNKNADKCRRSKGEPEWFPGDSQKIADYVPSVEDGRCFDLTFKIRDVGATKTRHAERIKRLEEHMIANDVSFDNIMGYAEDNIESDIAGSAAWYFRQEWKGWKRPRSQMVVKQIKSWVNGQTRKYISEHLKDYDIPASYDTAFYVKYLPQVNTVMKEVARRLI